ncbi:MAG: glycoside hydrolase family 2 TIM barrel-domain containing protein [Calditrichia bacterium]
MKMIYEISQGWTLKPLEPSEIPSEIKFPFKGISAAVPGTVHTDLLAAGLIADPFYADNEKQLSWIHHTDWQYRTVFRIPEGFDRSKPIFLMCEGLDTVADIYLNSCHIARTDNMFRRYEFPIESFLKVGKNEIAIYFHSPIREGRALEEKFGKLPVAVNSERVYLRKAQYSFGWDWGPSFPTCGIWRPIYLLQPDRVRIQNVRFHTIALESASATVRIEMDLSGAEGENIQVTIRIGDREKSFNQTICGSGQAHFREEMRIPQPRLWWPNGLGEPHLYPLTILLQDEAGQMLDEWQGKVGICTVVLKTRMNDQPAFLFEVNRKTFFARGANWIPADSFLPRITPEIYRRLLTLAKEGGMNMIRVWGGGVYEDDEFYRLCDELGLLVWQDFMFACGVYPEYEDFLKNVEEEVCQNVNRLQHHASVALWCGNNENEWGWYADHHLPLEQMPGYRIFHEHIPSIVKQLDPSRPYWPSSPYGEEANPNSPITGNRHQWGIWSGWEDYRKVRNDESLFVTEFGFQGPANVDTLNRVIPQNHRHPQSRIFEFHNKQEEGTERLFRFLAGHLPLSLDWADFIYLAQLNQGLALKTCIEHWRSRWPRTAGSIIWQLNDCWPVTSWSLIDSQLHPKLAYFLVKGAFSDPFLSFRESAGTVSVNVFNSGAEVFQGFLQVEVVNLPETIHRKTMVYDIRLEENAVFTREISPISDSGPPDSSLVIGSLFTETSQLLNRNFYTFSKWKHLELPPTEFLMEIRKTSGAHYLRLKSTQMAFFVDLYHPGVTFSERGFILLPNEEKHLRIHHTGAGAFHPEKIRFFSLNSYLSSQNKNSG